MHNKEGFGRFDRTTFRGRRYNAARASLHPVLRRPNLEVQTGVMVERIVFEGRRAVGVQIRRGRRREVIRAGEIICCGGAINSPQLLQLSGVGSAALLEQHDIPVVADLPGVGETSKTMPRSMCSTPVPSP